MGLIITWIITIIASIVMEFANEFRIFKDIADEGYKVDIKKLSEITKQMNPDGSKLTFVMMLIPVFNMLQVINRTMQYNESRNVLLDQFRVLDVLEEMTDYEKMEYQKNPTGLNALIVPLKKEIELQSALSIRIKDDNGESEIFYKLDDTKNIKVVNATGYAANLTTEEQTKMVLDAIAKIVMRGIEKFKDIDTFREEVNNSIDNNEIMDLSSNKEENIVQSNIEQIEALENIKNEIINGQSNENDGPKLTKKMK